MLEEGKIKLFFLKAGILSTLEILNLKVRVDELLYLRCLRYPNEKRSIILLTRQINVLRVNGDRLRKGDGEVLKDVCRMGGERWTPGGSVYAESGKMIFRSRYTN